MGKKPAAKSQDAAKSTKKEKVEKLEASAPKKTKAKTAEATAAKHDEHCKIAKCKNEYRAKGYCNIHYKKWKRGEYGVARYKTCGSSECRKPMVMNKKGYCEEHYINFYVKGEKPVHVVAEKPAKEEKQAASA